MQLDRQAQQLHAALDWVRRSGATPNDLVDLILDVDERLFHWTRR